MVLPTLASSVTQSKKKKKKKKQADSNNTAKQEDWPHIIKSRNVVSVKGEKGTWRGGQ